MLGGGQNALAQVVTLQPAYIFHPKLADQGGVLAKGFFDTAPARVARHVKHRSQTLPRAHRQHFSADTIGHFARQFRLEGAGQADDLREDRIARRHQPHAALFMQNGRNAQARLFDQMALELVANRCGFLWRVDRSATQARDLPDTVRQPRFHLGVIQHALCLNLIHPARAKLGDFFFKGHTSQQLTDP